MSKQNAAVRLVDTKKLPYRQWLDVRRNGIGSSDAAAPVGLCPYKSQLGLWMEKTGRTPPEEVRPGQDEAACMGFANGVFEELDDDVPAVVEEFYPPGAGDAVSEEDATQDLRGRLEAKMARIG